MRWLGRGGIRWLGRGRVRWLGRGGGGRGEGGGASHLHAQPLHMFVQLERPTDDERLEGDQAQEHSDEHLRV